MFDANLICPITTKMWAQIAALACVLANCNKSVLVRPLLAAGLEAEIAKLPPEKKIEFEKALERFMRQGELKSDIKNNPKE